MSVHIYTIAIDHSDTARDLSRKAANPAFKSEHIATCMSRLSTNDQLGCLNHHEHELLFAQFWWNV